MLDVFPASSLFSCPTMTLLTLTIHFTIHQWSFPSHFSNPLNPLKSYCDYMQYLYCLCAIGKRRNLIKGNNVLCMSKILLSFSVCFLHMCEHWVPPGQQLYKIYQRPVSSWWLVFCLVATSGQMILEPLSLNKSPGTFGVIWIQNVWLGSISVFHSRAFLPYY